MKRVLLSKTIHPDAMKLLQGKVDAVEPTDPAPEVARHMLADADALILRTNLQMTRELIESAPALKLISRTGVGVDNVDVEAATEKGILVCNTPGVNTISDAEQTLALLLGVAKQLVTMDRAVRAGNWKIRNSGRPVDVDGKVLGLVGLGRIGTAVAAKCRDAFNMRVIAYDPFVKSATGIVMHARLEDVLREADVVSVHVPYSKETHHLVNAGNLALMKPTAILINTSRGSVVDESALVMALRGGRLAGAGLDVLESEPPSTDNPLFALDNVLITPHSAALTQECEMKVAVEAARAVVDFFQGKQPRFVFNGKELGL